MAYWGGTADQIRDDVTGGKDNTPISVREKEDLKNPKNITWQKNYQKKVNFK